MYNKLLLPLVRNELRPELLTPPVDEEIELDEDGGPYVVRAEAEVSVSIVCFDYGVHETVSFWNGVVRSGWEGGLEEGGAEAGLLGAGGGEEG